MKRIRIAIYMRISKEDAGEGRSEKLILIPTLRIIPTKTDISANTVARIFPMS